MSNSPNIVFVVTDQQRFDTIAALGYDHVDTPNLDQLATEGTSFTHTYVTAPSCAPSRASLFTGVYPHTLGVMRNEDVWQRSWVERLAGAGYRCVNVGKMHTYPWESSLGFHERHVVENKDRAHPNVPFFLDQWDKALWVRNMEKPSRLTYRKRADYGQRLGAFTWELDEDMHADNFVGNLARWWLHTYPGDEPFFLQVGFPGPHPPYDPPARYLEPYQGREIPMPTRTEADLHGQPTALKQLRQHHQVNDHDSIVHQENPTDEQLRLQRQHYYANITMIDEQIGALRDTLERRGVLHNTVIVFTSDHGDCLNDHGHSQKWTMYDPSVRVPAIVWGPQHVVAGQQVHALISMMDLGPTVLELAGIEPPAWMEAQSLLPALQGENWSGRDYVFSEHARDMILTGTALMTMVCDGRWKMVQFLDSDEGQLFDLSQDPYEQFSRWSDPEYATVRAELGAAISQWRASSYLHTQEWTAAFR